MSQGGHSDNNSGFGGPSSPLPNGSLAPGDVRIALYEALLAVDPEGTGVVTGDQFLYALESAGIQYGTGVCDRLMTQIQTLEDGSIDFWRWAEDIESMMNTPIIIGASKRSARDTERNALAQEAYKEKAIKQRDFILGQKDKIYRAFCHFEAGMISEEDFLDFLRECGVDDNSELEVLMRSKATDGYLKFSDLMKACCLPGRVLTESGIVNENRTINWEKQTRSTDVVAWRDEPVQAKQLNRRNVRMDYSPSVGNRVASKLKKDTDLNDKDLTASARLQQERLYAIIRSFEAQQIREPAFRAALHDMRIPINRDLDILIARNATEGSVKFRDFIRVMNLPELFTLNYSAASAKNSAEKTHGDLIGWTYEENQRDFADHPENASQRPGIQPAAAAFSRTGEYLYWKEDRTGESTRRENAPHLRSVHHRQSQDNMLSWDRPAAASPRRERPIKDGQEHGHGDILGWTQPPASIERPQSARRTQPSSAHRASTNPIPALHETPRDTVPRVRDWRHQSMATRPW